MKDIVLTDINIKDSKILEPLRVGTAASRIVINNVSLTNIELVCYYILTISNWYWNDYPNSSIEINNLLYLPLKMAKEKKLASAKVSFGVRRSGKAKKKRGPKEKLVKKYNRQGR